MCSSRSAKRRRRVLRLLRSEICRMRRRWMPWIMLGLIVIAAFAVYFLIWGSTQAQIELLKSGQAPPPGAPTLEQLRETLVILTPGRVQDFGVSVVSGFGSIMLIVFAASHVGTEFGWGTFRTLLAHGASRTGFLVSKAASLLLYAAILMFVGTVAAIAGSYVVSSIAGLSMGSGVNVAEVVQAAAKSGYTFIPYMALALAIAVWSKSAGPGIATRLRVYFAQGAVATIPARPNKGYRQ